MISETFEVLDTVLNSSIQLETEDSVLVLDLEKKGFKILYWGPNLEQGQCKSGLVNADFISFGQFQEQQPQYLCPLPDNSSELAPAIKIHDETKELFISWRLSNFFQNHNLVTAEFTDPINGLKLTQTIESLRKVNCFSIKNELQNLSSSTLHINSFYTACFALPKAMSDIVNDSTGYSRELSFSNSSQSISLKKSNSTGVEKLPILFAKTSETKLEKGAALGFHLQSEPNPCYFFQERSDGENVVYVGKQYFEQSESIKPGASVFTPTLHVKASTQGTKTISDALLMACNNTDYSSVEIAKQTNRRVQYWTMDGYLA